MPNTVDCSVIAMWLGHESVETTQSYLHAHLADKEAAPAKLKPYERGANPLPKLGSPIWSPASPITPSKTLTSFCRGPESERSQTRRLDHAIRVSGGCFRSI
jgi:hypothetical protein